MCGLAGFYGRSMNARRSPALARDGRRAAPPRSRRHRPLPRRPVRDVEHAARDRRPRGRRPAAVRRARPLLGDAERRDLQPRRAAGGARAARPPVRDAPPTPRSSPTPTRSGASAASTGSTATSRSPSGIANAASCCSRATASASGRSSSPSTAATSASPPRPRRFCAIRTRQARARPGRRSWTPSRPGRRLPDRSLFAGIRELAPGALRRRRSRRARPADAVVGHRLLARPCAPPRTTGRRAGGAAGRRDAHPPARRRAGRDLPERRPRLVGDRGDRRAPDRRGTLSSPSASGSATSAIDESAAQDADRSATSASTLHRTVGRRGGDRRGVSARGRARREADAAHRAGAAAAPVGRRPGCGAQGRAHRRGRGRALRRLRHLPRGQGAALLGARPRLAPAPAAASRGSTAGFPTDPVARRRLRDSAFTGRACSRLDDPLYSHRLRFLNTARCLRLLDPEVVAGGRRRAAARRTRLLRRLPAGFERFSPLGQGPVRRDRDVLPGLSAALPRATGC